VRGVPPERLWNWSAGCAAFAAYVHGDPWTSLPRRRPTAEAFALAEILPRTGQGRERAEVAERPARLSQPPRAHNRPAVRGYYVGPWARIPDGAGPPRFGRHPI
jgi:hypothetical protein